MRMKLLRLRNLLWPVMLLSACQLGMPDPGTLGDRPGASDLSDPADADLGSEDADLLAPPVDSGGSDLDGDTPTDMMSTPTNASLKGVWGRSDALWVVGNSGTILFWDGTWTKVDAPTQSDINAVHGTASGEAWAVGDDGTMLHLPGPDQSWQQVASPVTVTLHGVWAGSTSDVWAVGNEGTVVALDGTTWTPSVESTEDLLSVSGRATDDVWISGNNGLMLHWTGKTEGWKASTPLTTRSLRGVWVQPDTGRVWAAGPGGTIASYDGSWTKITVDSDVVFQAVGGAPTVSTKDKVWAVGERAGNGVVYELVAGEWIEEQTIPQSLRGVWGSASGEGWAVGVGGAVLPLAAAP